MRDDEKRVFQGIIDGFEANYHIVRNENGQTDNPLLRIAFYEATLVVVRDGPRLKSRTVQYNLIRHYERLLKKEVVKARRLSDSEVREHIHHAPDEPRPAD